MLAGATVAAQYRVLLRGHGARGDLRQLHRAQQPLRGDKTHSNAIGIMHDQRRQHQRQHHRRQHRLHDGAGEDIGLRGFGQQHEAELAAGAQPQAGAQRRAGRGAEQS